MSGEFPTPVSRKCETHCDWPKCTLPGCVIRLVRPAAPLEAEAEKLGEQPKSNRDAMAEFLVTYRYHLCGSAPDESSFSKIHSAYKEDALLFIDKWLTANEKINQLINT